MILHFHSLLQLFSPCQNRTERVLKSQQKFGQSKCHCNRSKVLTIYIQRKGNTKIIEHLCFFIYHSTQHSDKNFLFLTVIKKFLVIRKRRYQYLTDVIKTSSDWIKKIVIINKLNTSTEKKTLNEICNIVPVQQTTKIIDPTKHIF